MPAGLLSSLFARVGCRITTAATASESATIDKNNFLLMITFSYVI
jgi:hypothetical protein